MDGRDKPGQDGSKLEGKENTIRASLSRVTRLGTAPTEAQQSL
jgi:hypothetical protein